MPAFVAFAAPQGCFEVGGLDAHQFGHVARFECPPVSVGSFLNDPAPDRGPGSCRQDQAWPEAECSLMQWEATCLFIKTRVCAEGETFGIKIRLHAFWSLPEKVLCMIDSFNHFWAQFRVGLYLLTILKTLN